VKGTKEGDEEGREEMGGGDGTEEGRQGVERGLKGILVL